MLDVIKSYLVSLGFSVDADSYGKATNTMNNAGKSVADFANKSTKEFNSAGKEVSQFSNVTVRGFITAGVAVNTFILGATVGITKFIGSLAKSDIQMDIFAQQMWTSKENATSFKNTTDAMGVSLNDLYLSPELMKNFQSLRKQADNMKPPKELQDMLKEVRSVQYEFTRMKLEATYALQWIGYYFIKYMEGPISKLKLSLQGINDTIVKTMPHWTKIIAEVMSWFARMGMTIIRAIQDIGKRIGDLSNLIPEKLKLIGGAFMAFSLIIRAGPFGILATAIAGAIIALDDFYTYLDGGKSQFGSLWKSVIDFYNALKNSGAIDSFKNTILGAFKLINKVVDGVVRSIKDLFNIKGSNSFIQVFTRGLSSIVSWVSQAVDSLEKFFKELQRNGAINSFKDLFINALGLITDTIETVIHIMKTLLGIFNTKGSAGFVKGFIDGLNFMIVTVDQVVKTIGQFFDTLQRTGAIDEFKNIIVGAITLVLDVFDYFKDKFEKGFSNLGDTMSKHQDLWDNLKQIVSDFATRAYELIDKLKEPLGWIFETGLPGIAGGFLTVAEKISDVIAWLDKFGGVEAIIWGIVGALAAWELGNLAVAISTGFMAFVAEILPTIELIIWGIKNATNAWEAAQWLLNVAMDANPLGVIILLIGLLITGIVLLVKNWDSVKTVAGGALQWIIDKVNALIKILNKIPGVKIDMIGEGKDKTAEAPTAPKSNATNTGGSTFNPSNPFESFASLPQRGTNYIYPSSKTSNTSNNNVSTTFNITGSNAQSIAGAVQNKQEGVYTRAFQGVII